MVNKKAPPTLVDYNIGESLFLIYYVLMWIFFYKCIIINTYDCVCIVGLSENKGIIYKYTLVLFLTDVSVGKNKLTLNKHVQFQQLIKF